MFLKELLGDQVTNKLARCTLILQYSLARLCSPSHVLMYHVIFCVDSQQYERKKLYPEGISCICGILG